MNIKVGKRIKIFSTVYDFIIFDCVSQTIKRRMQKELAIIIQRTSQQILDYHPAPPADEPAATLLRPADSRDAKLLQELLQVLLNFIYSYQIC